MRDVLANETITNNEIAMILYCVVHEECGDYDLSKKELKIAKKLLNLALFTYIGGFFRNYIKIIKKIIKNF